MAKKDATKRLIRPKTPQDCLARLPQFEPHPTPFADLQEYDVQVQREQGIDVQDPYDVEVQRKREQGIDVQKIDDQGEQRIDDVISKFMAPFIGDATKLTPIVNDDSREIVVQGGVSVTDLE